MPDDLKLTPSLRAMLERVERHNGSLLELSVVASGGRARSTRQPVTGRLCRAVRPSDREARQISSRSVGDHRTRPDGPSFEVGGATPEYASHRDHSRGGLFRHHLPSTGTPIGCARLDNEDRRKPRNLSLSQYGTTHRSVQVGVPISKEASIKSGTSRRCCDPVQECDEDLSINSQRMASLPRGHGLNRPSAGRVRSIRCW
jgi:hypothetical protein